MKNFVITLFTVMCAFTSSAQTQILYEDFDGGVPSNWDTLMPFGDYSVQWYWTTAGPANWTNYGYAAGGPRFPTNFNGWMIVDSDNGTGAYQVCDLVTPTMNLSTFNTVRLRFYEQYVHYNNSHPEVWVSPDGINYDKVYERTGLAVNQATPSTPKGDMVDIDISKYLANAPSAIVRFRWNGYDDYWWNLDDVELYEPMADDMAVIDVESNMFINCGEDEFTITIENKGADDATAIQVGFQVPGSAPVIENLSDTLEPGEQLTHTFVNPAVFTNQGLQDSKVFVYINGDGDQDNDTLLIENYFLDSLKNLPMVEDFDKGIKENVHIYTRKHGDARVNDTARFSGPFGLLVEGGLSHDWSYVTDTGDVFKLNELHATYVSVCINPDTAVNIDLNFSGRLEHSYFIGAAEGYFANLRLTVNGIQEWALYDSTIQLDRNIVLDKFIDNGKPMAVTFESRNKYGNKGATIANGGNKSKGDFAFIDPIDIYEVVPPIAQFLFSKNNLLVNFTDSSFNKPTSWIWDFGDGDTAYSQNPVHLYDVDGIYTACLIALNKTGSDTICDEVNVQLLPPIANFSFSKNGLEISFTDESFNFPDTWDWAFGDGSGTSTEQNPAYNYSKAKRYTVCLDVTNSAGADDLCRSVIVEVGIDENDILEQMLISPNPAQHVIEFKLSLRESQDGIFSVIDLFGRTIYSDNFNGSSYTDQIDVSQWPSGLYILHVKSEQVNRSTMIEIAR